jgi:anaerobic selenocysteine-containing dehydrogenase
LGRRAKGLPQRWLLSALLRSTGQGGFSELLAHEHGRLREPHRADDFLGERVLTDDGRVDLAPGPLLESVRDLERWFVQERGRAAGLRLITRRAVTTHNSWTHNHPKFVGREGTNYLYIHPDDAKRIGLDDGALADVSSDTGTVRVPVSYCPDLMPGTVALPHGWGHQSAPGLSVASKTSGVNVNLLAPDGPGRLESVSGMAHLTGLDVDVVPARGPQSDTDWSGL